MSAYYIGSPSESRGFKRCYLDERLTGLTSFRKSHSTVMHTEYLDQVRVLAAIDQTVAADNQLAKIIFLYLGHDASRAWEGR